MSTAGHEILKDYIRNAGRRLASGATTAPCELCGAEINADQLTTAWHDGAYLVLCPACRYDPARWKARSR